MRGKVKWVRTKVKARLYKLPFGYSFYLPPDQDLKALREAKWLIIEIGDYMFPARHHPKGNGYIVTVPRWCRSWLEELILNGKLKPKRDVKITIFVIP